MTSNDLVDRLIRRLLDTPSLHVPGQNQKGYRNKITYNVPIVQWSDLAEERVNDICHSVQCWHSQQQQQQQQPENKEEESTLVTIREVMVKVSRQDEFMVRLTVDEFTNDKWTVACKNFLLAKHPQIVCLCYNVCSIAKGRAKPFKDYQSFHFLTEQKYMMETTRDGQHQFRISPDTFSEVNTKVEDQQYWQKKAWLCNEPYADVLLVSGRDVSSFALSYRQYPDQPVVAIQHDPLVHRDALINLVSHATVLLAPKEEMAKVLQQQQQQQSTVLASAQSIYCVTTGGRHGMNPAYLQYLISNDAVHIILYNSCNTKSLIRDMRGFLAGGFWIQDFRRFDLFPNTNFTASVTKLIRRPTTLLLPIGPAGVGKTTLATQLESYGMECFRRDELYAYYYYTKTRMSSGKAARRQLHIDLLDFLAKPYSCSRLKMVDSTNGNATGRNLYMVTAQAQLVVLVNFRCTDVEFLLQRTSNRLSDTDAVDNDDDDKNNRSGHPFFPTTIHEQRAKHERILSGIQYAENANDHSTVTTSTIIIMDIDHTAHKTIDDISFEVYCTLSASQTIINEIRLCSGTD